MAEDSDLIRPTLPVATRTLLLSGFEIENVHRQPTHAEILCTGPLLTARVPMLIALTDEDEFNEVLRDRLSQIALRSKRTLVMVSSVGGKDQLGWLDFMETMGGPVPSWRALASVFADDLITAGKNELPTGLVGEAWRVFEGLAADGFEFALARRVRRLGGGKRGSRVSDMLGQLPEGQILVIDAKATAGAFDAAIFNLRPLAEYTKAQKLRQRGYNDVHAAVVISNLFQQSSASLGEISRDFLADVGVPVCFITTETFAKIVGRLREKPGVRNGLKWRKLFAGGEVSWKEFTSELESLQTERY